MWVVDQRNNYAKTAMLNRIIFTLDYEIHGNGDGCPYKLMVEPTNRLMDLLEKYGARLTIMADVAEILCFKSYLEKTGDDKFHYKDIESQLCDAIKRGHDVQLHVHSSYFKSEYNGQHWDQCIEEYNMAALPYERIDEMVSQCVNYLNGLLKPIDNGYECHVFRAANWSMMPTENIYKALVNNGITIDTSVYKGGCQGGNVCYDYREAYSNLLPYKASCNNINEFDENGMITEYPIYTEMRHFWSFISPIRIFRMIRAKFHKHKKKEVAAPKSISENDNRRLTVKSFFVKSPWKFDFNQANGAQMIGALGRIRRMNNNPELVPVVLIGHSKTFVPYNEKTLEKFLKYANRCEDVDFGLLK